MKATKFRTETAAIAASNGWTRDASAEDTSIDAFERGGVESISIAYTESDRISYAHAFDGSGVIVEIAKGSGNKLSRVRDLLVAEPAPAMVETEAVEAEVVEVADSLATLTKPELMERAVLAGIKGRRKMNKAQLIAALRG